MADGAGSAAKGGQGAFFVCRRLQHLASVWFAETQSLPSNETIEGWILDCRQQLARAATTRKRPLRDFASTLIAVIASYDEVITAHIGDGAVVIRNNVGQWEIGSKPFHGTYAATTAFLTDEPGPSIRFSRHFEAATGLALFTDGLERLLIQFDSMSAYSPFFTRMLQPLEVESAFGQANLLSRDLAAYLNGPSINAKSDDDKTLVLATRR